MPTTYYLLILRELLVFSDIDLFESFVDRKSIERIRKYIAISRSDFLDWVLNRNGRFIRFVLAKESAVAIDPLWPPLISEVWLVFRSARVYSIDTAFVRYRAHTLLKDIEIEWIDLNPIILWPMYKHLHLFDEACDMVATFRAIGDPGEIPDCVFRSFRLTPEVVTLTKTFVESRRVWSVTLESLCTYTSSMASAILRELFVWISLGFVSRNSELVTVLFLSLWKVGIPSNQRIAVRFHALYQCISRAQGAFGLDG